MQCEEARHLLRQDMRPGTREEQRIRLGFHLSGCPQCRAYRDHLDGTSERLLAALLSEPQRRTATPVPPQRERYAPVLRRALMGAVILLAALCVLMAGRTAWAVYQIRQNVQAMIVATPTPPLMVVAAAPRSLQPTVAPEPSAALVLPAPTLAPTVFVPPSPTPVPAGPSPGDPITVLLLGNDLRLDEQGPARADSLMLARIDPQQHRIALLSLTRDLMADIPGYGYARVNAANTWGGPELARQTISNLFQIKIDYYAEINFAGFISMVDSLGGVDVLVDKEIYQPGWELHFMPGINHMDGLTALRYSRIRMPDSDYDRIKRQQTVLLAIANRLRDQASVWNLQKVADLTTAMRGYVQTDMPPERMLALAWAFHDMSLESIERYSVEGSMVSTGVVPGDYYAQVPNAGVIEDLRGKLLGLGAQ
ncbi:MAG TPA: LCP family protein [Roseiflexaceae bacterium]|jgi:LCP family protein required for cell wall assembly|nr:LCP family protein [Roseiflexaceae bacterium]